MKGIGASVADVKAEEPEKLSNQLHKIVDIRYQTFPLQPYKLTYAFDYASPNSCHETFHVL